MTRVRSPNYPAFSLPAALDRVKVIHKAEGNNAASREAMAKHIGFGGVNGASAVALSALSKYGLIESVSDGEARVTQLALRILYSHSPEEKAEALREAASRPALFAEISEKWPDRSPSDENLRSYLVRKGFSQGALDTVIQIYRDTIDIAVPKEEGHNPPTVEKTKEDAMPDPSTRTGALDATPPILRPFNVTFDGAVVTGTMALRSVRDIDKLVKVLNAQKAALEAMRDDDDEVDAAERPPITPYQQRMIDEDNKPM